LAVGLESANAYCEAADAQLSLLNAETLGEVRNAVVLSMDIIYK
jgi:hypothetical protein